MASINSFEQPLTQALAYALSHVSPSNDRPVAATATLSELRAKLEVQLSDCSMEPSAVIADLVKGVEGGILGSAGGRFFGWVIGGALPAALAADWLTAAWDNNAALYACGPTSSAQKQRSGQGIAMAQGQRFRGQRSWVR
jgi:hypothetical protein